MAEGVEVHALIVDDIAENRDIISEMLGNLGCEVAVAASGREALEQAREQRPDIVFLDIRMPGMNGLQTATKLREIFELGNQAEKNRANESRLMPKLIAISASVLAHEQREYIDAGFDDFIGKPYRFERLCDCLTTHLNVRLEYAPIPVTNVNQTDWSSMKIPNALWQRLSGALEMGRITEFKEAIEELRTLGAEGQALASHIEPLIANFDTDAIVTILKSLEDET